jgi:hypothetical protein
MQPKKDRVSCNRVLQEVIKAKMKMKALAQLLHVLWAFARVSKKSAEHEQRLRATAVQLSLRKS